MLIERQAGLSTGRLPDTDTAVERRRDNQISGVREFGEGQVLMRAKAGQFIAVAAKQSCLIAAHRCNLRSIRRDGCRPADRRLLSQVDETGGSTSPSRRHNFAERLPGEIKLEQPHKFLFSVVA